MWWGLFAFIVIVIIWYFFVYLPSAHVVVKICYFYMPGCAACALTEPYWNKFEVALKQKHPNIVAQKVNINTADGKAHADEYGVKHVPLIAKTLKNKSFSFYEGGKIQYDSPANGSVSPAKYTVTGWDVESLLAWI